MKNKAEILITRRAGFHGLARGYLLFEFLSLPVFGWVAASKLNSLGMA